MKKIFLVFYCLLTLVFTFSCLSNYAQLDKSVNATPEKEYNFDYLIEYDYFLSEKDSVSQTRLFFTNSKSANYNLVVYEKDSLHYHMEFYDQDKISFEGYILKENFITNEEIEFLCKHIKINRNYFKHQISNYGFTNLKDTLLENKSFIRYKLSHENLTKKGKRFINRIGTNYYIIQNETQFHVPILRHSTAYEEYKKERNIPKGIFKEMYWVKNGTNVAQYLYKLKKYNKIDLKIIIEEGCEFYKKE